MILDLHQWMVQFDPSSIVELDYAELCDFQRWDELDDDHSAARSTRRCRRWKRGEYPRAADVYQGVLTVGQVGAEILRSRSAATERGQGQNRTADTAVFSRVLCQLSYLAPRAAPASTAGAATVARPTGFDPAISALTGR